MADYGAVPTHDTEEAQQTAPQEESQSCLVKLKNSILHPRHRKSAIAAWVVVLAITATIAISLHYSFLPDTLDPHDGDELNAVCRSDRSAFIALMLSIFLGPLGIDRLYLGYVFIGIIKFLTAGLGGILWVVDIVLLVFGDLPDHNGCWLH
ncbi:hypothetical protein BGW37DRAFT_464210 [Umbelopsis sp. PMI_123]|nr:hypothetical protein BGW37DRAFT_464210 [Umbelopsis sp. PMI_123]